MKTDELLGLLELFTTQTELTPHWNDNKPEWMKHPYIAKGIICATNSAIGISIDPKKFDCGNLDLPVHDNKSFVVKNLLPKDKRWFLLGDWVSQISDVTDEPYQINIGEGKYYEEFWRPIKAAYYQLGANKLTVLNEPTEYEVLAVELMDGVRCYIMPFLDIDK